VEGFENVGNCIDTLNSGWHLFGTPRGVTPVAEIYQEPAAILTSVFGFDKGYYLADTALLHESSFSWFFPTALVDQALTSTL